MPFPMQLKGEPGPFNGDLGLSPPLGVEGLPELERRYSTLTSSTMDARSFSCLQRKYKNKDEKNMSDYDTFVE